MASESINNQTVNILIMLVWQPQKNGAVLHMFGKTLVNEYVAIKTLSCFDDYQTQLEQLERLRSEIPPTAPWLPILVIHIRSQVKTRQSQSYKIKKIAKNSNFEILQETLHAKQILKLLDKMYKHEMDPNKTADRTWDAGWTDGQMEWNQYTPPNNFVNKNSQKMNTLQLGLAIVSWWLVWFTEKLLFWLSACEHPGLDVSNQVVKTTALSLLVMLRAVFKAACPMTIRQSPWQPIHFRICPSYLIEAEWGIYVWVT